MVAVSAVAVALVVVIAGVVDHPGPDTAPAPASPPVSVTNFVHTPCVYVNPGAQWHCPPGALPPQFP